MAKEKSHWRILFIVCGTISCFLMISMLPWAVFISLDREDETVVGKGSVSNLQKTYERWAAAYGAAEPSGPVVSLIWNKGLSCEFSKAKGIAQFNLAKGTVSIRVKGLEDSDISDVWLVDNQPGPGRSVLPEPGDKIVNAGSLKFEDDHAWLDVQMAELMNFKVDLVVVARRDGSRGRDGVLYGTTSLFQKIYHYPEQTPVPWQPASDAELSPIKKAHATGVTPPNFFPGLDSDLINEGRRLFFNETFEGNGRTCGTCHKEDDNMALGIKTIAALPNDDPLFIVEQEFRQDGAPNPLFNEFRMEKPTLMRKLGLILENLDGFIEPDGSFTERAVMRAPNHVLSVRTTIAPPPAEEFDDGTLPVDPEDLVFAERTGWSGDGTPTGFREDFFESNGRELTGSLRDFAIGAIVQHFPLTLERSAAADENGSPRQPDFRFATEQELNALEAFMLSLGRQAENQDLNTIKLLDEVADRGRLNFMGFNVFDADPADGRPPLNCNACHFNGGGNTDPEFPFPPAVTPNHDLVDLAAAGGSIPSHNRSFGPQVERLADQAGDIIVQVVDDPSVAGNCFDQGLAEVPLLPEDVPGDPSAGCDANPFDNRFAFGFDDDFSDLRIANNRFNAPPVFEAMDNPPFFHGHQINTAEGSVAFYATNRHLRNGDFLPAIVPLNGAQVINVARFMRVMGADFNAESAITLLEKALQFPHNQKAHKKTNIKLALSEIEDAVELLEAVQLHFSDAVPLFEEARVILEKALHYWITGKLEKAINKLEAAQAAMIDRAATVPEVVDTDGDGVSDFDETTVYGTDPDEMDTDGDGINDSDELTLWGDNWGADFDGDGLINILDKDSDGDGMTDGLEVSQGSDPGVPDTSETVVSALNAGGMEYVDTNGVTYQTDTFYSGGWIFTTLETVGGTDDDILYQSERYGDFSYDIPVENGLHRVTLKFAEIYWSAPGQAVFNVEVEGQEVISELDLVAEVGSYEAYDVALFVDIGDGILNISISASVDLGYVNAILVEAVTPNPDNDA